MNKKREHLKGKMTHFLDLLIDSEISEIRAEITQVKATMSNEIQEVKSVLMNEINSIQDNMNKELLSIRKRVNEQQITADEVAEKESTIYKHIQSLAVKIAESLKDQEISYTSMFTQLEKRVHTNEETLYITRDDHEKLALLLKTFAKGVNALNQPDKTIDALEIGEENKPLENSMIELTTSMDFKAEQTQVSEPQSHHFIPKPMTKVSN